MIHYHGGPITPDPCAIKAWKARHAFISFAHPSQIELAFEICQSVALDCGEFSRFNSGKPTNWPEYYKFVANYSRRPNFDFAIIPDMIGGGEEENDALLSDCPLPREIGCAVWHTEESIGRLVRLANTYYRVAIGSSGEYDVSRKRDFLARMREVLPHICDADGFPICKLHGLRMLNPEIYRYLPLSSADSQNCAINIGLDASWSGRYSPKSKPTRAHILVERIEAYNGAQSLLESFEDGFQAMEMF